MGIKSTITLTREQAENKYAEILADNMKRKLRAIAVSMSDRELEDALEEENDKYYRETYYSDTGFDNYIIEG